MDDQTPPPDEATDDRCPHCGRPVGDAWLVCAWCGEQIAAAAELEVGATLSDGRYRILSVIGRGGFGITYEAGDSRLKRRVAIKELFPDSAVRHGSMVLTPPHARPGFRAARDRFIREARVLARFTHPGIVRVFEVFEEHGTAYLVMELLAGCTLVDILRARNRPFTEDEVLDVAGRVAAALRPVHAAGVLHRDLNPSNVMLTEHGRIVLIDFGLARDFDQEQTVGMTRVVTPGYAPLEQYRGEARFGPSTDVYGLAATCYRLATGKVPVAAIERDGGAALQAPHRINPAISKQVSDAILDGLELEPAHRPQDLDSFLARLQIRRLPQGQRSILLGSEGAVLAAREPEQPVDPPGDPAPPAPPVVADAPGSSERSPGAPADDPTVPASPTDQTEVDLDLDLDRTRPAGVPSADATVRDPGPAVAPPGADLPDGSAPASSLAEPGVSVPPGRRSLTIPLAAVAVATGSAAPVLVTALVVLVVLPLLATLGDTVAHRQRAQQGIAGGWAERRLAPGSLAPARFVRNVAASVVRCSPIIGMAAVLLGGWYLMAETSLATAVLDAALRVIGAVAVGLIVLTNRDGTSRFRTGQGIDELVRRYVPGGRTSERVIVGWILAAIVVAAALWLSPDAFPLP